MPLFFFLNLPPNPKPEVPPPPHLLQSAGAWHFALARFGWDYLPERTNLEFFGPLFFSVFYFFPFLLSVPVWGFNSLSPARFPNFSYIILSPEFHFWIRGHPPVVISTRFFSLPLFTTHCKADCFVRLLPIWPFSYTTAPYIQVPLLVQHCTLFLLASPPPHLCERLYLSIKAGPFAFPVFLPSKIFLILVVKKHFPQPFFDLTVWVFWFFPLIPISQIPSTETAWFLGSPASLQFPPPFSPTSPSKRLSYPLMPSLRHSFRGGLPPAPSPPLLKQIPKQNCGSALHVFTFFRSPVFPCPTPPPVMFFIINLPAPPTHFSFSAPLVSPLTNTTNLVCWS